MVNWSLIGRATARYTFGYGGGVSLLALLLLQSAMLMLLVVIAGLLMLMYSVGSEAKPAPTGNESGRDSMAVAAGFAATGSAAVAKEQPSNLKALFTGIGLLMFGFGAMMAAPYI